MTAYPWYANLDSPEAHAAARFMWRYVRVYTALIRTLDPHATVRLSRDDALYNATVCTTELSLWPYGHHVLIDYATVESPGASPANLALQHAMSLIRTIMEGVAQRVVNDEPPEPPEQDHHPWRYWHRDHWRMRSWTTDESLLNSAPTIRELRATLANAEMRLQGNRTSGFIVSNATTPDAPAAPPTTRPPDGVHP